jgi:hypothetical protein
MQALAADMKQNDTSTQIQTQTCCITRLLTIFMELSPS